MNMFGVQKELSIYKALIDLFPKEKMVPQNVWQVHRDIRNRVLTDQLDRSYVYAVVSPVGTILFGDKPNLTL